jgi:hypothetical protein
MSIDEAERIVAERGVFARLKLTEEQSRKW